MYSVTYTEMQWSSAPLRSSRSSLHPPFILPCGALAALFFSSLLIQIIRCTLIPLRSYYVSVANWSEKQTILCKMHKGANYSTVTLCCSMYVFWQDNYWRKGSNNENYGELWLSEICFWQMGPSDHLSHIPARGAGTVSCTHPFAVWLFKRTPGEISSPCLFLIKIDCSGVFFPCQSRIL